MTVDLRDDDALLSEALAPHVDADAESSDPGCYALAIAVPDEGHDEHARRWLEAGYGTVPPYLPQIVECEEVVYVGRSSNVRVRLEEHLAGRVRTASLPSVYDVKGIVGVRWGANDDHHERNYRDDLAAELGPNAYVHAR
jgi:hypothetical protein